MSVVPASSSTGARATSRQRRPTATANFGSGRRESHDATAFYDRFVPPELSTDTTVATPTELDVTHIQDARKMAQVADNSVALVVTSPPYFAGKQYEESLGENGVPATYFEYLELLHQVFAECKRVLEPGGRIAVNVANLGRRPYRSLSGDVTEILQDLGLLMRGEVVWWKGRAAGGSCAWGTFQRPANPVLRDVTERIVIASKGRFDRALSPDQRFASGLPSTATISREEFMEATTDLWELAPESATRVGHPAPFPVELPQRLIDLYTYESDVVLDPFMGSGTTAIAAVRTGRRYIGFETDPTYAELATQRVDQARAELSANPRPATSIPARSSLCAVPEPPARSDVDHDVAPAEPRERAVESVVESVMEAVALGVAEGRQVADLAATLLSGCGFTDLRRDVTPRATGVAADIVARDATGTEWAFLVSGGLTSSRSGLRRSDTLWKALGQAAVLGAATALNVVLLSTDMPGQGTNGHRALKAATGAAGPVAATFNLLSADHATRLVALAARGRVALAG